MQATSCLATLLSTQITLALTRCNYLLYVYDIMLLSLNDYLIASPPLLLHYDMHNKD
jgi:hypothetical protein